MKPELPSEQTVVLQAILSHLNDQQSNRRWRLIYRFATLGFIAFVFFQFYALFASSSTDHNTHQAHTAVIDIRGIIDANEPANADSINEALEEAAQNKWAKGIILRINSPGGSPVQARQIYHKMRQIQDAQPNFKIYAVIEDLGASAAYLIASGAREIHADKTSIIGSIGVIMEGFGFTEAMQKWGIERRIYSAGRNKGFLDPFSPRNSQQEAFMQKELDRVHAVFIQDVKDGRGNRLRENEELFTGLIWCGEHALSLGLIDGYKTSQVIAKEDIQASHLIDYTPGLSLADRLANRLSASLKQIRFF